MLSLCVFVHRDAVIHARPVVIVFVLYVLIVRGLRFCCTTASAYLSGVAAGACFEMFVLASLACSVSNLPLTRVSKRGRATKFSRQYVLFCFVPPPSFPTPSATGSVRAVRSVCGGDGEASHRRVLVVYQPFVSQHLRGAEHRAPRLRHQGQTEGSPGWLAAVFIFYFLCVSSDGWVKTKA